jgi:hypothetical protein
MLPKGFGPARPFADGCIRWWFHPQKPLAKSYWHMALSKIYKRLYLGCRAVTRHDIIMIRFTKLNSGGVHIHIFMFCPTDFFWKRLFLWYVNMNIWIQYVPPPRPPIIASSYGPARFRLSTLYCKCIPTMLKETSKKKGRNLNIKEKRKEFWFFIEKYGLT